MDVRSGSPLTKVCCTCRVALPTESFNRARGCKDGLYPSCRPCAKQLTMAATARRGEEALKAWKARKVAYDRERYAERRDIVAETSAAYYRANRQAYLSAAAAWREKNPDRRRTIVKSYKGRRRSAERDGISGPALAAWADCQIKVCHWCSVACASDFHIDHYHPLAKGGRHVESNLVIACPKCNLSKQATDPIKFAHSKGRLF